MNIQTLYSLYSSTRPPTRCGLCQIPLRDMIWRRTVASIDLAHIYSRGRHGERANDPANVLWLCDTCHRAHHTLRVINRNAGRDEPWPAITTRHLLRAKRDQGEFDANTLAGITGYTARYITDLTRTEYPARIAEEREAWLPPLGVGAEKHALEGRGDCGEGGNMV